MSYASLIRDTLELLKEESTILASQEDAQYFRTILKKSILAPVVIPSIKKKVAQDTETAQISSLEQATVAYGQDANEDKKIVAELPQSDSTVFLINGSTQTPKVNQLVVLEVAPKITVHQEPPALPPSIPPKKTQDVPLVAWRSESTISIEPVNFSHLKAIYQRLFPQMPLIQTTPADDQAKKIANRWKTKNQAAPISILYFSEPGPQKELLIAITKAIDVYFGPARLIQAETIEKEKQWETFLSSSALKLVIACDYTLWQLTDLMQYFKEKPSRTLKNVPLFLLPDLSLYLKDPSLKRSLWKAIQRNVCS
ncbi:MAG TPA: hypothetical protein VLE96_06775 [Chlamydiales bacterium]|nr:hypothetical protein [Chlamydiales bacterium]